MTYIKELISNFTEATTVLESDKLLLEQSGALKNIDKFQMIPMIHGAFCTGVDGFISTTFAANLTPYPLLSDTWNNLYPIVDTNVNMTPNQPANRLQLVVAVPAGASTSEEVRLVPSGVVIIQKTGGGASTFSLRIARNGSVFSTAQSVFTLNNDSEPIAVPLSGLINVDNGDVLELYIERISGTGDISVVRANACVTGLKMRNG